MRISHWNFHGTFCKINLSNLYLIYYDYPICLCYTKWSKLRMEFLSQKVFGPWIIVSNVVVKMNFDKIHSTWLDMHSKVALSNLCYISLSLDFISKSQSLRNHFIFENKILIFGRKLEDLIQMNRMGFHYLSWSRWCWWTDFGVSAQNSCKKIHHLGDKNGKDPDYHTSSPTSVINRPSLSGKYS